MLSTWQEPRGIHDLVLRQRLFSSHRRYCGSTQHSDLFAVIIMVARCVRGLLRWMGWKQPRLTAPPRWFYPPPPKHPSQKQILVCTLPVSEAYIGNLQDNSCL